MAVSRRIELFGGLRIIDDTPITHFYSQKAAALLAYLASYRDRAHPRDVLIEMLWPWASPTAGRHSLSQVLSSLRHQLEPPPIEPGSVVLADRHTVRLNPATTTTDVAEFDSALAEAAKAETLVKTRLLEEAVTLYRGEFLAGFYEPWVAAVAERLVEDYLGAVEALTEILVERGEAEAAVSRLERAIEAAPFREEPYRRLMKQYAVMGEPSAALEVYGVLAGVLSEGRGEKPSAAAQELAREMERLAAAQPATAAARSRTAHRPPVRRPGAGLPTGTVTFLAIQGVDEPPGMELDLSLVQEEIKRQGGARVETDGGSQVIAFSRVADALGCAAACQLRVAKQSQEEGPPTNRPAMVVHSTGVELSPDGTYSRVVVEHVVRLLATANPAQVLCSETTAGLVRYNLDGGLRLRELGLYRLRGTTKPERFYQLDYPGGPAAVAPLDAQSGHMSQLPLRLARFIGRQHEMEQLAALLTGESRLVTLVGGPGCGKTRLAIEVASQMVEEFAGRVWFVPLADLRERSDILDRALDPLGIRRQPKAEPIDQIAGTLAEQRALIVFDNFEHLTESAGEVRSLLERLPHLCCLVTSRRRLGLAGEREFQVRPLPMPGDSLLPELLSNESARLFVDRAQAVRPDFQVTAANAEALAGVCSRLEGVPLAIELAAARSRTHGLQHILDRLTKGDDLAARIRDADDRHRSLRAAVQWSYSLLSQDLQRFFARLSVFRGGWTVEAAEAVCGEPMAMDRLTELADCSLVQAEHGEEPRFHMPQMIRDFARERLEEAGELEQTSKNHVEHYYTFLHTFGDMWGGPGQTMALDRVESELDNFLAAMDWCDMVPDGVARGLSLAGTLYFFWVARGHVRLGRSEIERALRRDPSAAPDPLRTKVINNAALLAFEDGDLRAAKILNEQALAGFSSLGDKQGTAANLHNIARILRIQGSFSEAKELAREALAINEDLGNRRWAAFNLALISDAEFRLGETDTALERGERAAEMLLELGDLREYCFALDTLGDMNWECGRLREASDTLMRALASVGELKDSALSTNIQICLAKVHVSLHEFDSARALIRDSLPLARKCEAHWVIQNTLQAGALLLSACAQRSTGVDAQEDLRRAVSLISATHESFARVGVVVAPSPLDRDLEVLRSRLDDAAFGEAWNEGKSITIERAMDNLQDWLGPRGS